MPSIINKTESLNNSKHGDTKRSFKFFMKLSPRCCCFKINIKPQHRQQDMKKKKFLINNASILREYLPSARVKNCKQPEGARAL